jgi:predicted nucleic acid-binding protein
MQTASDAGFFAKNSIKPWPCIHGEQTGRGIAIDFPDLIIGATALHLGFGVVTLNVKHFQAIPGLPVIQI